MTVIRPAGLLARVLPDCLKLSEASELVRIDKMRLAEFAGSLVSALPGDMRHTPHHFIGDAETTAAYFIVLDTLNFGSGYFEHLAPYNGETGYYAVATALRDWFVRDGVPAPSILKTMTPERIGEILGQPRIPELVQLMDWFARALRELGQFTDKSLDGRFQSLLTLSGHDASDMVDLLCQMPMFQDVAEAGGESIHLLKRAQICVQDIAIAASEDGLSALNIHGLEHLTVFADNMLPFILEAEGVLVYDSKLAQRIQAGEYLGMSSRAELELRANSITACELLRQNLKGKGISTTAREIDFALWNIGDRQSAASPKRLHVCRSWFY